MNKPSPVQSFWQLVSHHQAELRSLVHERAALSDEFLEDLQDALQSIDTCLTVFCTPAENAQQVNMVFGCDGYQDGIELVLQIVASAPELKDIHAIAFSPRAKTIPDGIDLNGLLVNLEDVYYSLRQSKQGLHLDIYLEDMTIHEDDLRVEAVLMFLEAIVGEYDLMTRVASIDWHDMPADPLDHGLRNLTSLRQVYDDLGKIPTSLSKHLH